MFAASSKTKVLINPQSTSNHLQPQSSITNHNNVINKQSLGIPNPQLQVRVLVGAPFFSFTSILPNRLLRADSKLSKLRFKNLETKVLNCFEVFFVACDQGKIILNRSCCNYCISSSNAVCQTVLLYIYECTMTDVFG